jgi:hypothetical protein
LARDLEGDLAIEGVPTLDRGLAIFRSVVTFFVFGRCLRASVFFLAGVSARFRFLNEDPNLTALFGVDTFATLLFATLFMVFALLFVCLSFVRDVTTVAVMTLPFLT